MGSSSFKITANTYPHAAWHASREIVDALVGNTVASSCRSGPGRSPNTLGDGYEAGAALFAAIEAPAGVYNVVSDGGRVSNQRFKNATGWRPAF